MPSEKLKYDLIAFDVDGTLVGSRNGKVVWQLLNAFFGCPKEVCSARYHAYLAGQITYKEWVDLDIQTWVQARATRSQIEEVIANELFLMPGTKETLTVLHQEGYRLAVISGTLDITLSRLFAHHPCEVVYTNKIWFDDQEMIAGWEATPYDMAGKAEALSVVAQQMNIPLSRTVFVGDNINDIPVMNRAGLAIAFEPKEPSVKAAAHHVVEKDLRGILPYLLAPTLGLNKLNP